MKKCDNQEKIQNEFSINTNYLASLCAVSCVILDGLTYPFETLKTKIQFNKDEFLSMNRGFKKYTKKEGIK